MIKKPPESAKTKIIVKTLASSQQQNERPYLFDIFRTNFNAALDEAGYPGLHYGRQVEVARVFQISTSAARKWVMGECIPDWDNMLFIADTLNVSVDALLGRVTTNLKNQSKMVSIPLGIVNQKSTDKDWVQQLSSVQFETKWLEGGMRLKHEDLQLMVVAGNNMAPTLEDGDIIFVDTRAANNLDEIEDNAIYLFRHKERPLIRRVQFTLGDSVDLVCDNKSFNTVTVPRKAISSYQIGEPFGGTRKKDTLVIIGKVQWAIKRVARDSIASAESIIRLT